MPDPVPGRGLSPPRERDERPAAPRRRRRRVGTKDLSPSGGDFDFIGTSSRRLPEHPERDDHRRRVQGQLRRPGDASGLRRRAARRQHRPDGSCFDLAKCFAGAVGVGQSPRRCGRWRRGPATPLARRAAPPAATAASAGPSDAGPKPFKDFRPAAVTFDRTTCTIQLNGADPARLNIAIVTPDTGECVRAGECYVPIDRGAAGWQEDGTAASSSPRTSASSSTARACASRRRATSAQRSWSRTRSARRRPATTRGIFPVADAGDGGPERSFAIAEDFPTAWPSSARRSSSRASRGMAS